MSFLCQCSEDLCLVKKGPSKYLGDGVTKEMVTNCDRVHFSCENEWTQKGQGCGKTHVTLIQEMNSQ